MEEVKIHLRTKSVAIVENGCTYTHKGKWAINLSGNGSMNNGHIDNEELSRTAIITRGTEIHDEDVAFGMIRVACAVVREIERGTIVIDAQMVRS